MTSPYTTDPRGNDDPLDGLSVLTEAAYEEIHAYCAPRLGGDMTDTEYESRRVTVMDGVTLILDMDEHVSIFDIDIEPDALPADVDYAFPTEDGSPYLSNVDPVFDRLRREISDAMNYDPIWCGEDPTGDVHRWAGYI